MVNIMYFQQINPNYTKPQIEKLLRTLDFWAIFDFAESSDEKKGQIKRTDVNPTKMKD